ncbi:MAG: hypothetical protein KDA37_02665, partial [Planctomycetales bacterium]|nr:hypothetical protein [Planctomycetales bacterium]
MPEQRQYHSPEEDRYAELLTSLAADAPPVDAGLLATLRTKSAEEFTVHAALRPTPKPKHPSMASALTALTAAAATAATILWAVVFDPNSADHATPFGKAMAETAHADTLQLELRRGDTVEQLWVRPTLQAARWAHSGDRYSIIRGTTQWDIKEAENKAVSRPALLFPATLPGLDLFSLLMIPADVPREPFLEAAPVDETQRDGKTMTVYRWRAPYKDCTYFVEAWVDARARRLVSLQSAAEKLGVRTPLAVLSVVSINRPVDEDLFMVGKHLTEDGRIGKVVDLQGTVTLRPVMHHRWTPAANQMLLRVGDWVRTDVRGANAVTLRLASGASLTLGPGSLAELTSPTRVRLVTGEAKLEASQDSPVRLSGPA